MWEEMKILQCRNCGAELKESDVFCPNCGTRKNPACPKCGREILGDSKFCSYCGQLLVEQPSMNTEVLATAQLENAEPEKNLDDLFDTYRDSLCDKQRIERGMLCAVCVAAVLTCLAYYNAHGDLMEAAIAGSIIGGIAYIIYGVIGGSMGVYQVSKYLEKYDRIKAEVGKKAAVEFIEKEFKPEKDGLGPAINSMKVTGGCVGGCLQGVIGIAGSIIAIVLLMAFC